MQKNLSNKNAEKIDEFAKVFLEQFVQKGDFQTAEKIMNEIDAGESEKSLVLKMGKRFPVEFQKALEIFEGK